MYVSVLEVQLYDFEFMADRYANICAKIIINKLIL